MSDASDAYVVDRCVCTGLTFAELRRLATVGGRTLTLDELASRTGCCKGCRMCEPYVVIMLQTGETRFPLLPPNPQ